MDRSNITSTQASRLWLSVLLCMLWVSALAQVPTTPSVSIACDYASEPAIINLTATTPPAGYSTTYLLVDRATGVIAQVNTGAPSFSAVTAGIYYAVAAHYTGILQNATTGKLISTVFESNTGCLTYSTPLPIRVCSTTCDYALAPALVSATSTTGSVGTTTIYVLVDELSGLIAQTSPTPSFSSVSAGDYTMAAVSFSGSVTGLTAGGSLYDVATSQSNCQAVSNSVHIRVCACATPSVGGTVAYLGSTLCNSTNAGTVTLSGNTGSVVKWQTSIDGGTNWIDLVGWSGKTYYSFVNAINGQQYRAVVNSGSGCSDANSTPATINTSASVCTPVTCDNTSGQIAVTVPSSVTGNNFTKQLIATDASGIIQYVSAANSTTIASVAPGSYYVYRITFDNTIMPLPTLAIGTSLSGIGGGCVAFSNQVAYKVCLLSSPTVAILSPATNGTATTTPTISGTATPNAVVTLTGGPGSTGGPVSVTADPTGVFSTSAITFPPGPASLTAVAVTPGGASTPAVTSFTAVPALSIVRVNAKVILAGAYVTATGLMRDDLRTKSLIPLADPYSTTALAASFTHTAGSAGTSISSGVLSVTGNDAIVDWVFVQLRDPLSATAVVATRAALLQRDGDIVDLDGTSPLSFTAASASANFYVSVRHRNHLGVMTQSPVALSSSPVTVDFTSPTTPTYGVSAERLITLPSSATVATLWPGNANVNKTVIYQGSGNDLGTILSQVLLAPGNSVPPVKTFIVTGYLTGDLNLDGNVIYQGSGNELGTVLGTVLLHPANSVPPVKTFIVSEQLP